MDSNSFFLDHSYGANSEVAGIVTLLAVVDQLGKLKRSNIVSMCMGKLMLCMLKKTISSLKATRQADSSKQLSNCKYYMYMYVYVQVKDAEFCLRT